jgi:hypothetical protein
MQELLAPSGFRPCAKIALKICCTREGPLVEADGSVVLAFVEPERKYSWAERKGFGTVNGWPNGEMKDVSNSVMLVDYVFYSGFPVEWLSG